MSQGVPVEGKCRAGHRLRTTSLPGRVTWTGDCPTEGCTLQVKATRIPTNKRTPASDEPTATAPPATKPGRRVKKVVAYRDDDDAGFRPDPEPAKPGPGGGKPRVRPTPVDETDVGSAGGGDDDRPTDDDTDRRRGPGRRPRRRRLLRRDRRVDVDHDPGRWTIPGIYP